MTLEQVRERVLEVKGEDSWRQAASRLGVAFPDLHSAGQGKPPKKAVLAAIGVEKETVTHYKLKTPNA